MQQLKRWLEYKYRTRRICYIDNSDNIKANHKKTVTEYRTPERKDNDLIFALNQCSVNAEPRMLYYDLAKAFGKTLDRIGKGKRENSSNSYSRRQITFHNYYCTKNYNIGSWLSGFLRVFYWAFSRYPYQNGRQKLSSKNSQK